MKTAQIVKITAAEILKRDGDIKGYKYTAHFDNGTGEVIRKNATRLYENAFHFAGHVNYAVKDDSLAGNFTLGKKAPKFYGRGPVATYPIRLEG